MTQNHLKKNHKMKKIICILFAAMSLMPVAA